MRRGVVTIALEHAVVGLNGASAKKLKTFLYLTGRLFPVNHWFLRITSPTFLLPKLMPTQIQYADPVTSLLKPIFHCDAWKTRCSWSSDTISLVSVIMTLTHRLSRFSSIRYLDWKLMTSPCPLTFNALWIAQLHANREVEMIVLLPIQCKIRPPRLR